MSIGFTFTGEISRPEELIAAARTLAEQREYRVGAGDKGLRAALCPLGGELTIYWQRRPEEPDIWHIQGECVSTPAGPGLHRAAVELVDALPIRGLRVEDETGFFQTRDFLRMREEHFYPWLRTLVDICRQESGKGACGMRLCWDLEQYAPQDIPDTVVTPMGRFRLAELVELVEQEGIAALAERFFLWNGRTRDAQFYRARALNLLWERCRYAPSGDSGEDEGVNNAILRDLERAAKLAPELPLPRAAYEEICALAGQEPSLPEGPALAEEFSPGYRKGPVTYAVGALRLTLPGRCRCTWEQWENGGGAYLWSDITGPVWRVNSYRTREGDACFTHNLDTLHGVEGRTLKGGALRWGWREIREGTQRLYQVQCEVITGPSLFVLTAACSDPRSLGSAAEVIGNIRVAPARREDQGDEGGAR